MDDSRVKILNVGVSRLDEREALDDIELFLSSNSGHQIVTLNPEMIVRADSDSYFCKIINEADLVLADGTGVLMAADYLSMRSGNIFTDLSRLISAGVDVILFPEKIKSVLPAKVSGIDLMCKICSSVFMEGKKIYLLGAGAGIAEESAHSLKARFPRIEIVGAEEGFWGEATTQKNEEIIEKINSKNPDVIFVALGAPKQEKWIYDNLRSMRSVRIAIGVGGAFDILSGRIRRAPIFLQRHGLEWLWRLALEPRRIKRIYTATFRFMWLIFQGKEDMMEK